ncbi:hypothetical protein WJX72_003444 [[Myrmecia] bisecta]|uniref:DUF7164 domain-containing protein n=1 Tax=[Myrmecia] bisecta TaxID=41462 RepID=A0AAW1QQ00_9CHLO
MACSANRSGQPTNLPTLTGVTQQQSVQEDQSDCNPARSKSPGKRRATLVVLAGLLLLVHCAVHLGKWHNRVLRLHSPPVPTQHIIDLREVRPQQASSQGKPATKLDLLVFGERMVAASLPEPCLLADLRRSGGKNSNGTAWVDALADAVLTPDEPQCIFIPFPGINMTKWFGYGYANSLMFFEDPAIRAFLNHYSAIVRTDFDVFLTPALLELILPPGHFMTGRGGYSTELVTRQRLNATAHKLRLRHRGIHHVGSTWYGPPAQMAEAAFLTNRLQRHLLVNEFEQKAGGGPVHLLDAVGWPEWYAGVTLLYAGELALNHLMDNFTRTEGFDGHSDSDAPLGGELLTIHCWHSNKPFGKFQFFAHQYSKVAIDSLNPGIVKDYCMDIAVRSVRHLTN